jgi:hypothetical protein
MPSKKTKKAKKDVQRSIAYYDEDTGWTIDDSGESVDSTIEQALENLRDDGRLTIEVDQTIGSTRVVEGTCCGDRFVLVGVIPVV